MPRTACCRGRPLAVDDRLFPARFPTSIRSPGPFPGTGGTVHHPHHGHDLTGQPRATRSSSRPPTATGCRSATSGHHLSARRCTYRSDHRAVGVDGAPRGRHQPPPAPFVLDSVIGFQHQLEGPGPAACIRPARRRSPRGPEWRRAARHVHRARPKTPADVRHLPARHQRPRSALRSRPFRAFNEGSGPWRADASAYWQQRFSSQRRHVGRPRAVTAARDRSTAPTIG
jgi:hypothetical protein